jgi:hypothetical protein
MNYSLKHMGIAEKVIDPKAWTLAELNRARHESNNDTVKTIREKLASGEWELVWKRSESGRMCKAYRPKGGKR